MTPKEKYASLCFLLVQLRSQLLAFLLRSVVFDDLNGREPLRKLVHPVPQSTQGSDDQYRTPHPCLAQTSEEADHLDGLSQTHFVRQHAMRAIFEETHHPTDSLELVGKERSLERLWLLDNRRIS